MRRALVGERAPRLRVAGVAYFTFTYLRTGRMVEGRIGVVDCVHGRVLHSWPRGGRGVV